jgi:hypothetical protein
MEDWLQVVWNRRLRVWLKKRGMLVLDAFEGHWTLDARYVIQLLTTGLAVMPGGMNLNYMFRWISLLTQQCKTTMPLKSRTWQQISPEVVRLYIRNAVYVRWNGGWGRSEVCWQWTWDKIGIVKTLTLRHVTRMVNRD